MEAVLWMCATWESMEKTLGVFWARFQSLYPSHDVFQMGLDLRHVIPFYSHQDDGRGYKHLPIWIFSSHGCLGRGTSGFRRRGKHRAPPHRNLQGMNFCGNTWADQFLFCTMLRNAPVDYSKPMEILMEIYASDVSMLAHDGLISKDGTKKVHFIHVASKGDLPALSKVAGFTRHFLHAPRGASSAKASGGICPWCLAGQEASETQEAFRFEDFSLDPAWASTVDKVTPWTKMPALLKGVPADPTRLAHFFATDLWHNFCLGIGKHFLASSFVVLVEHLDFWPESKVDSRLEFLSQKFREFCKSRQISPYMTDISRLTLGFPSSKACPVGQWSKGQVTADFMCFLEQFITDHAAHTDDELIRVIVT